MNINEDIERQLVQLLRRLNGIQIASSRAGISLERSTYAILCLVVDEGPQRLGRIASTFHLDPSTITRQVQTAERLGFLSRSPDPQDGRAYVLDVTPAGREAVNTTRTERRASLGVLLDGWTDSERDAFLGGLLHFNQSIDALEAAAAAQPGHVARPRTEVDPDDLAAHVVPAADSAPA